MGLDLYHLKVSKNKVKDRNGLDWHFIWNDIKNIVPSNFKKLFHRKMYHYYDWESFRDKTGFDVTESGDFEWCMTYWDDEINAFVSKSNPDVKIEVHANNVPTRDVNERVIYFEEIGYQRKGMKSEFYDDDSVNHFIATKKGLKKLRSYVTRGDGRVKYFDEHFVKNFVEGESLIYASW